MEENNSNDMIQINDNIIDRIIELVGQGVNLVEAVSMLGLGDNETSNILSFLMDNDSQLSIDQSMLKYYLESKLKLGYNLPINISNVQQLATNARSEKVRLEASIYLINRVMGNPTNKIQSKDNNNVNISIDVLGNILEEI